MAVGINEFSISEILSELDNESITNIYSMFNSPLVDPAGLDPTYCTGLTDLRTIPYTIGKWRNYEKPQDIDNTNIVFRTSRYLLKYNITINLITILHDFGDFQSGSTDIAISSNKIWISKPNFTIEEFNITTNPFTITFNRNLIFNAAGYVGSGLEYIPTGNLLVTGNKVIHKFNADTLVLVGNTFTLPHGANVTGDILYVPTLNQFIISYTRSVPFSHYLGKFTYDGQLLFERVIEYTNIFSMFEDITNNKLYAVRSGGEVFEINPTTLTLTYIATASPYVQSIIGASQIRI